MNEYYECIRNNFGGIVFFKTPIKDDSVVIIGDWVPDAETTAFDWIQEAKKNVILFGEKNDCNCYNHGITFSYFIYLLDTTKFKGYASCDNDIFEHLYKNISATSQKDVPIDDFSSLIMVLINSPQEQPKAEPEQNEPLIEEQKSSEPQVTKERIDKPQEEIKNEETVANFDFVGKGFPLDSLSLYGIDLNFFNGLDEVSKEEILKTEQKKYDEKKSYDFEANGFSIDCLTLYAIDKEYFEGLPDDLKNDVLQQARTEYNKKEEEKQEIIKDAEKHKALINKLRIMTIRENALLNKLVNDKGLKTKENFSEEDWLKLCSGITELDEESKNHLLRVFPYELIKELPQELRQQAKKLRKNYVDFYRKRTVAKEDADSCSSSLLNIAEENLNFDEKDIFDNTESVQDIQIENKDERILFENYEKNEELERVFNNLSFYEDLPEISDNLIMNLSKFMQITNDKSNISLMSKVLKSLCLNPRNAYKILDSFVFMLTFYQGQTSKSQIISPKHLNGSNVIYNNDYFMNVFTNFFEFLIEKKVALPLLLNAYIFGCTALIYENSTYQFSAIIQENRNILSQQKNEAKKESILEKIMIYKKQKYLFTSVFFDSLKNILIFKEDLKENQKVEYPQIISNLPKSVFLNYYVKDMDLNTFLINFDRIQHFLSNDLQGFINLIVLILQSNIEKSCEDSNMKKAKILEFKNSNQIVDDISALQDSTKRESHWAVIYQITEIERYTLKDMRKYGRNILKELKKVIDKFAKQESKKRIDPKLEKENPEKYKEERKQKFYLIIEEILNQINEKIHQNEIILKFFKDYFELCFVILNIVGTNFSFSDYYPTEIYKAIRHTFKFFIDLYSFLNPLDEEYQKKKESESPNRQTSSKLSKLRTSAPEEEKKEVKFKSEKIGKIFSAFARKADVDISLKNSLSLAYGNYCSLVEIFIRYGLSNNNRISKNYFYYVKKAPTAHSINTNVKFAYLTLYFSYIPINQIKIV